MIVVYSIVAVLIVIGLIYIDKNSSYNEIPILKWAKENGEFYFSIPYYIWQGNKIKKARKVYSQNTILDFDGYKYQITNFGGTFPITNGVVFFERELRFWGEPLNSIENTFLLSLNNTFLH